MIMTREQIEAIAQKHVNDVLAEINRKVEREKERIEMERIERESKAREKQLERELARERAAQEKAEKEKARAEQRERKAEEKRIKVEAKQAEKRRREDEKKAQKDLKVFQQEQVVAGEGLDEDDAQRDEEAEPTRRTDDSAKQRALNEPEIEHPRVTDIFFRSNIALDNTVKGNRIKSWLKGKKERIGKRLSRVPENKDGPEEDLYGERPDVASNGMEPNFLRADSLRNVTSREQEDDAQETSKNGQEESEGEVFNDALEEFEEPQGPPFVVKEEQRKMSSERGSRFREEF